MKSKDQLLLEEAYSEVLLNEVNWKGVLAAGALAATSALGGNAKASETSNDFVSSRIETIAQNAPEKEGTSYLGGVEIYRYLALADTLTPEEKALIQKASELSYKHGVQKMNEVIAKKNQMFNGK